MRTPGLGPLFYHPSYNAGTLLTLNPKGFRATGHRNFWVSNSTGQALGGKPSRGHAARQLRTWQRHIRPECLSVMGGAQEGRDEMRWTRLAAVFAMHFHKLAPQRPFLDMHLGPGSPGTFGACTSCLAHVLRSYREATVLRFSYVMMEFRRSQWLLGTRWSGS